MWPVIFSLDFQENMLIIDKEIRFLEVRLCVFYWQKMTGA